MDEIITSLQWSRPEIVQGRALVTAPATQDFWKLWKQHKIAIKQSGIFVTKKGKEYQVGRWLPVDMTYTSRSRPVVKKITTLKLSKHLREYQRPHTKVLVKSMLKYHSSLDASSTGAGKTYTGIAMARELDLIPFVVCKKIGIAVWKKVAKDLGVKGLIGINYEMLRTGNTEYARKKRGRYDIFDWLLPDRKKTLIIFDECHVTGGKQTLNSKLLISASMQGYKTHLISATVAESPLQMKAIGFALRLFPRIQDFWPWAIRNGCYRNFWGAFEFSKDPKILKKLHSQLFPEHGSRIDVTQVPGFPNNQIIADAYTMDSAGQIQKIYEEMDRELEELERKTRTDSENPLTIQLRARQKIELLKVPTMVEMAKDLLAEGYSVPIFVNFRATLRVISEKLGTDCVVHGEQTGKKGELERKNNIDRFQSNIEKCIVLNITAGGESISLHDTNGVNPRQSLISPTWAAKGLVQVLGRICRDGTKSRVIQRLIYTAKTVEEKVANDVAEKVDQINLLNDGDLTKGLNIANLKRKGRKR